MAGEQFRRHIWQSPLLRVTTPDKGSEDIKRERERKRERETGREGRTAAAGKGSFNLALASLSRSERE